MDLLELVFLSGFTASDQKLPLLTKAILRLDVLKFFFQLAWESKLLTTEQYSETLGNIEEIGRMLYGWKKGIENKTPARVAGER